MWLFTFEITSGQLSSQNKPLTEQLRLFSHDLKTEKSPFVFLREVCHMNSIAQQQEWAFDWLALSCNLPGLSGTGRTRLSTQTSRTNTYRDVQNCDPHLKQHVPFPRLSHPHMMAIQRCKLVWFHFCVCLCVSVRGEKKFHICISGNFK